MKKLIVCLTALYCFSSVACPAKYEIGKNITLHGNAEFTAAVKEMIKRNYILSSEKPEFTFRFSTIRQNLHYNPKFVRAFVALEVFDKNGELISFSSRGGKNRYDSANAIPLSQYENLMVALVDELPVCQ
jgi:hypothetical protein